MIPVLVTFLFAPVVVLISTIFGYKPSNVNAEAHKKGYAGARKSWKFDVSV